jgi:hypothetical protein
MSVHMQPISELTQRAKAALIQELGAVDTVRFLNQFRAGDGDYTQERTELFKGDTVNSLIASIKAQRQGKGDPK